MDQRVRAAGAHGRIAGEPFPDDEGRRLSVTVETTVRGPRAFRYEVHFASTHDPEDKTVHFEVESPFDIEPASLADPALLVALFPALRHGGELVIRGAISRRLARSVIDMQSLWVMARGDLFRPFRLVADDVVDAEPTNTEAIMTLTGGVDSMLALCQHTDPDRPRGVSHVDLRAALFIPGFSPNTTRQSEYAAATEAVRKIAARRDLPLAVAETNFAAVVDNGAESHGALLAAALTLFSSRFGVGLIASSVPFANPYYRFYGSSAWLDPMFSSGSMTIHDDSGDLWRDEKIAALHRYPEMLDQLLVCFEVEGQDANCCRCEKCTRTMMSFLALGKEIPAAFPKGIDLSRVGKKLGGWGIWHYARTTLLTAKATGAHHPALSKLKRRYLVKRVKWQLKYVVTWCLYPTVNFLRRDGWIPRWMIDRRMQAQGGKREKRPWYRA